MCHLVYLVEVLFLIKKTFLLFMNCIKMTNMNKSVSKVMICSWLGRHFGWRSWSSLCHKTVFKRCVCFGKITWASYQIRKIANCACPGNVGKVFPATDEILHIFCVNVCVFILDGLLSFDSHPRVNLLGDIRSHDNSLITKYWPGILIHWTRLNSRKFLFRCQDVSRVIFCSWNTMRVRLNSILRIICRGGNLWLVNGDRVIKQTNLCSTITVRISASYLSCSKNTRLLPSPQSHCLSISLYWHIMFQKEEVFIHFTHTKTKILYI